MGKAKTNARTPETPEKRLQNLYDMTIKAMDWDAAIKVHREMMELRSQAPANIPTGNGGAAEKELSAVRAHLAPLKLADDGVPVSELARLAVQRIVELSGGKHV